jgi:hypothetical protein
LVTAGNGVDRSVFDDSEDAYIEGTGWVCGVGEEAVDIYITKDRVWQAGEKIADGDNVKSFTDVGLSYGSFIVKWSQDATKQGKYDVLVECHNTPEASKKTYDPDMGDMVDGISVIGFEVLPELASAVLLAAGIASISGYAACVRRREE